MFSVSRQLERRFWRSLESGDDLIYRIDIAEIAGGEPVRQAIEDLCMQDIRTLVKGSATLRSKGVRTSSDVALMTWISTPPSGSCLSLAR